MFCEILKNLRIQNNLSQKELASKIDLSSNIVCEYEKGRSQPSIETLIKLSRILNCSIDYLVGNENDLGIINTNANLTLYESNLLAVVAKLSKEDQFQVLGFAQALAQ